MAHIDITHPHALGLGRARKAAEEVAARLADEYDLRCHWKGDVLHFERSGVKGRIVLGKDAVQVQAKLGLLLSAMQGTIEREIRRLLDKKLG